MLTYHCQFLLHGLSDHVGRGDVFNPQRRINGFMFFSLSVLNLEDHLGLVISPQSPLSAGYITLRACRRSLPLRFSTVTPGGIVGFLIVSYRFNIPDRLAVHLSIHARPELRAHCTLHPSAAHSNCGGFQISKGLPYPAHCLHIIKSYFYALSISYINNIETILSE